MSKRCPTGLVRRGKKCVYIPAYKQGYKAGKDLVMQIVDDGGTVEVEDLVSNFDWPEAYAEDVLGQLRDEGKIDWSGRKCGR